METFSRRQANNNPIHPYSWRAWYADGSSLSQFETSGYHYSHEIDATRVTRLEVLGHPDSPVTLFLPYNDQQPDKVIVKVQNTIEVEGGGAASAPEISTASRRYTCFFGYQYGTDHFWLEVDPDGDMWKTNSDAGCDADGTPIYFPGMLPNGLVREAF